MTLHHKHHIVPKHMGGTDDSSNLVEVTVEQHAALHKQLWEDLGHEEDRIAWLCLSGQISKAEAIKLAQRNYMKNRIVSIETREKMAEATRRRLQLKGHPMLGKKFPEHSKQKMSDSHKGKIPWNKNRTKSKEEIEKDRIAQLKVSSYECLICGKYCKGKGNLKQHLKKHQKKSVLL